VADKKIFSCYGASVCLEKFLPQNLSFQELSFVMGLSKESCLLHVECSIYIYIYIRVNACVCVQVCVCVCVCVRAIISNE